jgi:hypothetical protein
MFSGTTITAPENSGKINGNQKLHGETSGAYLAFFLKHHENGEGNTG